LSIRESELGQYSCSNLLRDMEVAMSESDMEDVEMAEREDELAFLPECVLDKFPEARNDSGLPENLHDLPSGPELSKLVTPHVTESLIKSLNLQLSQKTRAN
jgi:hypothetical protein